MRRILFLSPALLALATAASGQTLRGKVLDAASGEPVAQAAIAAQDSAGHTVGRARSAADGTFAMPLRAAGVFHLDATRTGYQPAHTQALPVDVRETVEVELRVSATPVSVAPLTVTARQAPPHRRSLEMNGFYDREKTGLGRFLRREDFDRATTTLAEALTKAQGTYLIDAGARQFIAFSRSSASVSLRFASTNPCLPKVYLDGTRAPYGGQMDINSIVSPSQVEAVELYRSTAEIPPQYGGSDATCGVILIWTRHEQ
jgi:hypothetical protein